MNFDAIVLGLNPSGIGVLQSLGERGVKLAGIDTNKFEIGFYSKFGEKYVCAQDSLLQLLYRIGQASQKKIVLFPTSDDYLLFISRNEERLRKYFHFPLPGNDLVEQLLDKYKFFLLASQYTNQLPECQILSQAHSYNWKKWPAIVKPLYIHEFRKHFPNCKAWVVNNKKELEAKGRILSEIKVDAFIQNIVKGTDDKQYSVAVYIDKAGIPREVMVAKKIRQNPPGFGVGTYVEQTQEQRLIKKTLDILKKIKYTGIAEVEYKKDECDGKFKLIEINARVWYQNKLASYGGKDIIGSAYSDCTGKYLKPLKSKGKKWFFFFRDMQTSLLYIKNRELSVVDIFRSYLSSGGRIGIIWNRKDPFAAIVGLPIYLVWKLLSHFKIGYFK
ncbi:D-aspartate ligase [Candidatus Magnetomoraceae bacterium gMMP-15]